MQGAFNYYSIDNEPNVSGLNQQLSCPDSVRLLSMRLYWAHPTLAEHRAYVALAPLRMRLYSLVQPLIGEWTVEEVLNRGKCILCDRVSIPSLSSSVLASFNGRYEYVVSWTLFGNAEAWESESCNIVLQSSELSGVLIRRLYDSLQQSIMEGAEARTDRSTVSEVPSKAPEDSINRFRLSLCIHTVNLVAELCFVFCREVLHITPEHGPWSIPAHS